MDYSQNIRQNLTRVVKKINECEQLEAKEQNRQAIVFENITPHTLRHSFATRAIEYGLEPKVVQKIMEHGSFSMTMDLYAHATEDLKRREMEKMRGTV